MQYFNTLFGYTFREGPKLKIINSTIIQSEHDIIIYQKDHIIKNIIQEYWRTKTKDEVKFHNSPLPLDTSLEK